MLKAVNTKSIIKSVYFWAAIWLLFTIYYAIAFSSGVHAKTSYTIAYGLQLAADFAIGVTSILAYLKVTDKVYKHFLLLVIISIVVGLFSTESYNLLVNIIKIKSADLSVDRLWVVSYTAFLLIQIYGWSYLLFMHKPGKKQATNHWLAKLPYILISVIILLSILFSGMFSSIVHKNLGVSQTINTALEVILFSLLSINLARSKIKSLSYLAAGFLFLTALNLAHRFSYLSGHYFQTFDVVWLVCYVVLVFGFIYCIQNKDEKVSLYSKSSIHTILGAVFVGFAACIALVFISLEFFLVSLETNSIADISILQENIPSILMVTFLLSFLLSKLISTCFAKPLERIAQRIQLLQENKLPAEKISNGNFVIGEINELDIFILHNIQQLKAANRVKSDFVMNMSHDFRTPASGIYAMSKMIYDRLPDQELKKMQGLVMRSSEQLLILLDEVLDYSRLDNEVVEVTRTEINVNDLIADVVTFILAKAEEKGLYIECQLPDQSPSYYGNRLLLHRILVNLVANAVKFTEQGGVTLFVDEAIIESTRYLIIKVKDTGIGIDEQYHQTIFEPFSRVKPADASQYQGIGLGLSNVKLMLKKLGGYILLESSRGEGAIFSIYLQNMTDENG